MPGRDSPIDSVDDFFRVRLVCSLLDCCGICFDRGSQKRKLDHFLTVFQVSCSLRDQMGPQLTGSFMWSASESCRWMWSLCSVTRSR